MPNPIDPENLAGRWSGTNRLWMSPAEPAIVSESAASVDLRAGDRFASIQYAWSYDGDAHDGVLLVRLAPAPGALAMVWVDSFHTNGGFMTFRGENDAEGRFTALGSYPAPPGPDWGWRIAIEADGERLRLLMHNLPPQGDAELAVDAEFSREGTDRHDA